MLIKIYKLKIRKNIYFLKSYIFICKKRLIDVLRYILE